MRTVIPADIDKEDRLLAGLTARQLAILTVAAVAAWGVILAAKALLPLSVAVALAAPIAALGGVLALGRRDGLSADRLALAALRQRRTPRRQVLAPEGVVPAPAWAQAWAKASAAERGKAAGVRPPDPALAPAPLVFPARRLDDDGVVDLGPDGAALVCRASPVNLGLRTPTEQDALVAVFARLLNAITAPLQILVRAERVDLRAMVAALREAAGGLPHPALEAACREHAAFLETLGARRDVLRREVLVVLREPSPAGRATASAATAGPALRRRAEGAAATLAAAGITLTPLDGDEAAEALHRAGDPEAPARPARLAAPDAVITGLSSSPSSSIGGTS